MKNVLRAISLFVAAIIAFKAIIWLITDEPIYRKSVLYLVLILLTLIVRNKWTFIAALLLFLLPSVYKMTYSHLSGLSPFEFTNNIYYYFENHEALQHFLLLLPYRFCVIMLLLFCFRKVRIAYRFHQTIADPNQSPGV